MAREPEADAWSPLDSAIDGDCGAQQRDGQKVARVGDPPKDHGADIHLNGILGQGMLGNDSRCASAHVYRRRHRFDHGNDEGQPGLQHAMKKAEAENHTTLVRVDNLDTEKNCGREQGSEGNDSVRLRNPITESSGEGDESRYEKRSHQPNAGQI
jgi:hypothetical protein